MSWLDRVGGLLKQYSSGGAAAQPTPDVNAHFDQVAQAAPRSTMGDAIAAALRSSRTPSFAEAVAKLFAQSNGEQKAGLLSRLVSAGNPGVLDQILSKARVPGMAPSGTHQVTPDQAQKVPPDVVQEIAAHAEKNNPNIVDEVSHFYAEHPMLMKTLGAAAVSVLLSKVAERHAYQLR